MIGFAGLSHLGLVSSAALASKGFATLGFDPDAALVSAIHDGRLPVSEPGLPELLADVAARPFFTDDAGALSKCDVVYVALDVPADDAGHSDLAPLHKLLDVLWPVLAPTATLVVLSQVPPGFTRRLVHERMSSVPRPASCVYQVETLIFGRAVQRALHPERFIVGCDDPRAPLPPAFRGVLEAFHCPILPMRYESAELAKIAINCFLVSSVSTTNMLAEICEHTGADWSEIAPALRLDARIGPKAYLDAGLGLGGGNLGRDLETVKHISGERGTDSRIVDAWRENSRYRRDWVLRTLHRHVLAGNAAPKLAVWGVAYKQDTASTKNSPALALLQALGDRPASVFDPAARVDPQQFPHVTQTDDALSACRGADVLLVMTPWQQFRDVPLQAVCDSMHGRTIIDPFGIIVGNHARRLGFTHLRLGMPLPPQQ